MTPIIVKSVQKKHLQLKRDRKISEDMESFNYDEMYENLDPHQSNGDRHQSSVISHFVSQLAKTFNPTKVRFPTSVLECHSLLESYSNTYDRPELFVQISEGADFRSRFEKVVCFYLSTFKCCRPIDHCLKPYNPVFGEVFECQWTVQGEEEPVSFVAEQVS